MPSQKTETFRYSPTAEADGRAVIKRAMPGLDDGTAANLAQQVLDACMVRVPDDTPAEGEIAEATA